MKHALTRSTLATLLLTGALGLASLAQAQNVDIYNTVKLKLAAGQKVVGVTVASADPEIYCAAANAGFDFVWIEMQHSPLTFSETARMIWACKDAPAIPFIRVPSATEGDIQKAVDVGALGVIVPMIDTVDEIERAVQYAHYPPLGTRSQGGGQYRDLYGANYRQTANENVMVVAMVENPAGVEIASRIANVEGVDVIFVASSDLGSFTGLPQGNPQYEALVDRTKDATLRAGLGLGGPLAWMNTRPEYNFFQAPSTTILVRAGAEVVLKTANPCFGIPSGVAPVEGEDPCP